MAARFNLVALIAPPALPGARCATDAAGDTVAERVDVFFADPRSRAGRRSTALAKTICADCPARAACGDYALRSRQAFGTWGGVDEDERGVLFRRDRLARRRELRGGAAA